MINAQTTLVGVIGWPIAHSLSPAMHNAAFDALGMNWRYLAFPVRPGEVASAIEGLRALGFRGTNVTVPHKETVMRLMDEVPPRVRAFGAVNTVIIDRDAAGTCMLRGENTDVGGLLHALREDGFEPAGKRVLVVGAGGGARGVVYALCDAGTAEIVVLNRTPARASALVADLAPVAGSTSLRAAALTPGVLEVHANEVDLLVNTTTVGMWPHAEASIWPDDRPLPASLAVCDLVYRPLETKLLRQAQSAGAKTIDGLGMLIAQGALSFEMWTGQWPPVDVMRAACEAVLEEEMGP
ncbi:MAG: shikimate dehydrogenase [Anaerolineae bacterium]|jgi:shikimate dehydrogenase